MLQKLANRNEKGFTLIELMIVIAIIGILAAIAIPNFISYRKRAYERSANADMKNAYTAAMAYMTDNPGIPIDAAALETGGFRSTTHVVTQVADSSSQGFTINSKHDAGDLTFQIDHEGTTSSS